VHLNLQAEEEEAQRQGQGHLTARAAQADGSHLPSEGPRGNRRQAVQRAADEANLDPKVSLPLLTSAGLKAR